MKPIKTVIGLFTEEEDVEGAINELKDRGYNPKDISLIMRDTRGARRIEEDTGAEVGEGAASGAATGAIVGGITGLLIGIGAITIPGVGAFLIGGPLAAALGLSGAAATTASGAMTGALAGGLIGALMSLGLPREEAERYETRIREGAILLAVPAYEGQEAEVSQAMDKFGASDIKMLRTSSEPVQAGKGHSVHDTAHHHGESARHTKRSSDDEESIVNPVQVQKYLKHVDYPATKEDLIHEAEEEGADSNVIHTLEDLPEDRFNGPTDVSRAIGYLK